MSDEKIPRLVPLPDVPNYTDAIVFGELGLPKGFDEERLLVNIGAFNRVRTTAGLGQISISTYSGESLDFTPSISGVSASGAATIAASSRREKRPLTKGNLTFPTKFTYLDYPDAEIRIDRAVLDQKVEKASGKSGIVVVRDPAPRAAALNNAVRSGLERAARGANFDRSKLSTSSGDYGGIGMGLYFAGNTSTSVALIAMAMAGPVFNLSASAIHAKIFTPKGESILPAFNRYRKSIFIGCSPDRYLAATAIIETHKFIKAAK